MSISEYARTFDHDGKHRRKIDSALGLLVKFREKYPFKSDPDSIDNLTPDDLFKKGEDYFFKWVEHTLKPLGTLFIGGSSVWRNGRDQIDNFKDLLRLAVGDRPLAEKVDAPWNRIGGMGGDKHIAKKIISCYDDNVIPIFKTEDLEHFHNKLVGRLEYPSDYDTMSIGEKYAHLNKALLAIREKTPETKDWDNPYFVRFLYECYSPPRPVLEASTSPKSMQSLHGLGLLFEPKSHDEVVFLFSKLHVEIGYPYIVRIQAAYPDVEAVDEKRVTKRIEIETYASQFNHDPKGCDVIVCWENDYDEPPEGWPEIVQLKDYL